MGLLKDQARANHVGERWMCTARRWKGCLLARKLGEEERKGRRRDVGEQS